MKAINELNDSHEILDVLDAKLGELLKQFKDGMSADEFEVLMFRCNEIVAAMDMVRASIR